VLPPPLGFGREYDVSDDQIRNLTIQMRIPTYGGTMIHFSDVARERGEELTELPKGHEVER